MIQTMLFILGAMSIWLVTREEEWRKWGFIVGLIGQPFWIYSSYEAEQWGILALSLFYMYSWSQGIYNNFIKNKVRNDLRRI